MRFKKIIMVLLLGLIFASPVWGQPIAYVNGSSKAENPSSNSIAASAQNHTGGNLLVVVVGGSGSVSVSSVTDTAGNTYSSCNTRALYAGVGWCEIWYAKNITGNSSNVVTAHLSANTNYRTIHVLQFSGCDALAPYDVGNTRTGNSSSQSTNPATTTQANELMVAGYRESDGTGSFTAGTSPFRFTLSDQTTPRLATEYRLDTGAAGSYGSSMTYSKKNKWAASHATFRKQTGDLTPPTGTIAINSGATSTNSSAVTLTLTCSDPNGCSQMQFSNNNVTYSTPEAYSTTKAWTLTSGDGIKTVYVKFKDTPGNWSSAFSDAILLDATPPITTASPVGGVYISAQSVTLSCTDGAGLGCDKIYYTTDRSTPTTSSSVYSTPIPVSDTTLKFFATDLAGNSEAVKTENYTIDTVAPTGTITINGGAASTNSTNASITLTCSDAQGCSQMQFSNDNVTYSTPEAYSTTKAWTLTSGDGIKTVYVKFKDTPGNWSSAFSDAILLDATPPTTNTSPAGGTYASAQSVTLSCNDGSGSGCDKIYYTTDGSTPTTTSPVYSSPINISVTTTLKFFATDLAGNSGTVKTERYTITTPTPIAYVTKVGIFHDGNWKLDLNGNYTWDLPGDMLLNFGQAGDKPVTGDWDGSGTTKIGTFRDGTWKIDLNGSGLWEWEGDRIYAASLNSSGLFNNYWTLVPGSAASSPALAWNPIAQKMQIVVRRAGDTIYAGSFNSTGVFNNDWTAISGSTISSPALAWNPVAQKMQIVVRRAGDTIYAGTFSSSGVFNNDWILIPGTTLSSPALAWNPYNERMQIVVRRGGNAIYTGSFDEDGLFLNHWDLVPGTAFSSPSLSWNPLALKMQIVARGAGDTIYAGSFNSAGVFNNDWTLIPGTTLTSPALAWNPLADKMQIVVRGADDTINVGSFNSMAAFNNDWTTIPGNTLSSPAIAWNEVTKTMQALVYGPKDAILTFGMAGDIPVTGDWDGSGITKIGIFRGGSWFLDLNGNGVLDPEDGSYTFGQAGDVPVTGDWDGSGITKIGIFRGGSWFLDLNGNGILEYPGGDTFFTFGFGTDTPVTTGALQTAEIDNLLRNMWMSMNNSLASGDIQTALSYITSTSKPSYEVMFNALINQLPSILATHREFNLIYIRSKEAKYELVALEDGELYSYDVIFTKHENNVWGIDDY